VVFHTCVYSTSARFQSQSGLNDLHVPPPQPRPRPHPCLCSGHLPAHPNRSRTYHRPEVCLSGGTRAHVHIRTRTRTHAPTQARTTVVGCIYLSEVHVARASQQANNTWISLFETHIRRFPAYFYIFLTVHARTDTTTRPPIR
jgi:hypothetical protein